MRIATALSIAFALSALAGPAAAQPASDYVSDIAGYVAAMKSVLAEAGIEVTRIDSPANELLVIYRVTEPATEPRFALGAVLCVAQPLAQNAQFIRARNVENGRRLLELRVPPTQLKSSLLSVVTDAQLAEIEALRAEVFARSGTEQVVIPAATETSPPSSPVTIVRQGEAQAGEAAGAATSIAAGAPSAEGAAAPEAATPAEALSEAEAQQLATDLIGRLQASGLENLSIGRDAAGQWIVGLENRTFRSDIVAVDVALREVAATLPPGRIMLRMKRHDVAISHIWVDLADYIRERAGMASPEALSETWEVNPGPGSPVEPVTILAADNDSFGRTDVLLRPGLEYQIGLESDPFVEDLYFIPTARTTWATGVWSEMRAPVRVTEGVSTALDRALLSCVCRPTDRLLATASAGRFDQFYYGYYGEVQWDNENNLFGAVGSLTDIESNYNPFGKEFRGFVYYQHNWGQMGLNSRLGWGKFHETDDPGIALSLRRRFGESEVEARAVRSDAGDEGLVFRLTLPLGPQRAADPADLRLRADPRLNVDYSSDFVAGGNYLQGSNDLESFRGELQAAYLQHHGVGSQRDQRVAPTEWEASPSFEGNSGLMRIPTADAIADGTLLAGISYMDREHSKVISDDTDAMPVFVGAGFLPNLELIGRLTFFHDVKAFDWPYNLDRSFNVHYRLMPQKGWTPAVAIGAQDVTFGTTTSFLGKAEYVVGSWEHADWRLHLGAGSGRYDPAFAGVEWAVPGRHRVHLMTEYDSEFVNAGVRLLEDWGSVNLSLLGMSELTGAVSFNTQLR